MTRDEALTECKRLAAEHPDRETHQWRPKEDADGSWSVVKINLPPLDDPLTTEVRADERPATGDDPRPDVPPHSAGF